MALVSSSIVSFPDDNVSYSIPTWEELTELVFQLSLQISEDKPNLPVMVTLAKGGFPLARILADFLQIPLIVSLGVRFYTGIGTYASKPQVYQDVLPVATIAGKNVLLFDDVADSGESLIFAQEYLSNCQTGSITTATLFYKEKSKISPDYFAQLTNNWIVFPFEVMETVRYLSARWQQEGLPLAEQQQRFVQLGIREQWLAAYTLNQGEKAE